MKIKPLIFSALLTAGLLEGALRLFHINDTYSEKINGFYTNYYGKNYDSWYWTRTPDTSYVIKNVDFSYPIKTNSLGTTELPVNGTFHLETIFFGDSFTEGMGVTQENSYVSQLERILDVNFYNAGVAGSDPFYSYVLLRDKFLQYQPKRVIFSINSTDYQDYVFRGGFERFNEDGTTSFKPAPFSEPLYHYSYLFRFLAKSFGYNELLIKRSKLYGMGESINKEFLAIADSLENLAEDKKFDLMFIIHPTPGESVFTSKHSRFFKEVESSLTDSLKKRNYKAINILAPMDSVINDLGQYSFKKDGHFNKEGYRVMAEAIKKEVDKEYPDFFKKRTTMEF